MTELSNAARELVLHADNTGDLYRSSHIPILKNLLKKKKAGIYNHDHAKRIWKHHADKAAQSYAKEYGSKGDHWGHMFPTAIRREAAAHWADRENEAMDHGEYKDLKENINEKWDSNYETPKSKRGMFKGRSLGSLEKEAKHVSGTKAKQVDFAIRAKTGWGKVKEDTVTDDTEIENEIENETPNPEADHALDIVLSTYANRPEDVKQAFNDGLLDRIRQHVWEFRETGIGTLDEPEAEEGEGEEAVDEKMTCTDDSDDKGDDKDDKKKKFKGKNDDDDKDDKKDDDDKGDDDDKDDDGKKKKDLPPWLKKKDK